MLLLKLRTGWPEFASLHDLMKPALAHFIIQWNFRASKKP